MRPAIWQIDSNGNSPRFAPARAAADDDDNPYGDGYDGGDDDDSNGAEGQPGVLLKTRPKTKKTFHV